MRAAQLVQRHRPVFREMLARFDGEEVKSLPLKDQDKKVLDPILREFAAAFGLKLDDILRAGGAEPYEGFSKLLPLTLRPYGRMYAY